MKSPLNPALERLLERLKNDPALFPNIEFWHTQTPEEPAFGAIPSDLNPSITESLNRKGIYQFYSHQVESWHVLKNGKNAVITTSTASGKSLCYHLPVLNHLSNNPDSTAIYIFPTKALAQDQSRNLLDLQMGNPEKGLPSLKIPMAIYDGDTTTSSRKGLRDHARILFTNPDMLHLGILPHHPNWERILRNLKFVVIDEIHTYRGLFGSQVANVIRRLKRIVHYYGTNPQFILTSATIANAVDHAEKMIEEPVVWINQDGSPKGAQHYLFYNPPILNKELGIRESPVAESIRLGEIAYSHEIQTILFTRSRKMVEICLKSLREKLQDSNTIRGYRSGYLPEERRKIEERLRKGEVRIIISTNALELGIDIGSLETVLLVGYPGTIAATRQQMGRVGRKQATSLAVLIASSSPIDQFLMRNPNYFFDRSPENALIDPDNLLLLLQHIRCAAFELPFLENPSFGGVDRDLVQQYVSYLVANREIHHSNEKYLWISENYPASSISLRNIDSSPFHLLSSESGYVKTIGLVDGASALWMVHPDAVYLHDGQSFLVEEIDFEKRSVRMRPADLDYYTEPIREQKIKAIQTEKSIRYPKETSKLGEVEITSLVTGFRKIKWTSRSVLQILPLELPETTVITTAFWFSIHPEVIDSLKDKDLWTASPNQYGSDWERQRNAARKRDRCLCQHCGRVEIIQKHHVHHIVPFRLYNNDNEANRLENLITLCPECHQKAESSVRIRSGLAGLAYSMKNMASLLLMCDQQDLGSVFDLKSITGEDSPMILFYDQIPGGMGLSRALFDLNFELLEKTHLMISQCTCEDGCPACVGSSSGLSLTAKKETLSILEELMADHELI